MKTCLIVAVIVLVIMFAPALLVAGGVVTLGLGAVAAVTASDVLRQAPPAVTTEDEERRRNAQENGRQMRLGAEEATRVVRIEATRQADERWNQAQQAEATRLRCENSRQVALDQNQQHAGQPNWRVWPVPDCEPRPVPAVP